MIAESRAWKCRSSSLVSCLIFIELYLQDLKRSSAGYGENKEITLMQFVWISQALKYRQLDPYDSTGSWILLSDLCWNTSVFLVDAHWSCWHRAGHLLVGTALLSSGPSTTILSPTGPPGKHSHPLANARCLTISNWEWTPGFGNVDMWLRTKSP